MKINQFNFYEALHSAYYAYRCYYQQNCNEYTAEEAEQMRDEILLLKNVLNEIEPWTCEEILIDEMPF